MKHFLKAGLIAATALLATAPVAMAQHVIMSNDNNAVGVKGQTFDLFAAEIRARLPEAEVEVFHSGSLFDQRTQIQGLQLGSATIISPTSGIYAPTAPGISALTLPFLLSTPEQIVTAFNDPIVREAFVPDLRARNIEPIAIWMNGPRELSYRGSSPILMPSDMAGVKIRVQNVPSDIAAMQAVGANVVAMSWSEVPTALQQGVIDAVEPTPNALAGAGLIEIINQLTRVSYQYSFYVVGANRQWWEGLSDEERAAIQEALDVATAWNIENAAAENAAAYEAVATAGVPIHDLTAEQRAAWAEAMRPVWHEFGDEVVGEAVMSRLIEISQM
ncbi:TRAP transporter substrate-binding protein [Cereibacter sphaeroides]|nr:TRAP transporter substrate-binding protein [Cereibacter sphaeroides]